MNQKILQFIKISLSGVLIILVCVKPISARSIQLPPVNGPFVSIEAMKPYFGTDTYISSSSSVWFLSAQYPLGFNGIYLYAEIPFSYYDNEFWGLIYSDNSLVGNPLIGVEVRNAGSTLGGYGSFAVRFPAVDERNYHMAGFFVAITDYDRFEAFSPDYYSLQLGGGGRFDLGTVSFSSQFHAGVRAVGLFPTVDYRDLELYLKYYGQFWIMTSRVNFNIGFTGVGFVTQRGLSLARRTEHQLSFGAQAKFGPVRPGAFIRIPLAEYLSLTHDYIAGVNLTLKLGN